MTFYVNFSWKIRVWSPRWKHGIIRIKVCSLKQPKNNLLRTLIKLQFLRLLRNFQQLLYKLTIFSKIYNILISQKVFINNLIKILFCSILEKSKLTKTDQAAQQHTLSYYTMGGRRGLKKFVNLFLLLIYKKIQKYFANEYAIY